MRAEHAWPLLAPLALPSSPDPTNHHRTHIRPATLRMHTGRRALTKPLAPSACCLHARCFMSEPPSPSLRMDAL
eukprot:350891-Chlamydomonas_euryale.AAC.5